MCIATPSPLLKQSENGPNGTIDSLSTMFSFKGQAFNGPQPRQLTWAHGLKLKGCDWMTFDLVKVSVQSPLTKFR
jgi:hypothetical protein